ncbi:DUF1015 family protein [Kineococcus sp. SYSU DK002]|uniref:DUF1015 family protein n=1 Tax=Kineococcus sp. SYSU DK002 TaxID=3383123 RepID=UPI003D7E4B1B
MEAARTGARASVDVRDGAVLAPPPPGPLLEPFPGLRYDPAVAGPLSSLVAPPHTELDRSHRAAFLASSPYVVTHLERPEYGAGAGPEVHRWLDTGVLVQDPSSFYVVRQRRDGRTQHFLLACLAVTADDQRVHPHEDVFDQAVAARVQRLDATGVDSEPVLLVDDAPWPVPWTRPEELGRLVGTTPHDDGAPGLEVWRLRDAATVQALTAASAHHRFLIADGHHRFAAVQRIARRTERPAGLLVAVVDQRLEPVDLQPLHRVLPAVAAQEVVEHAPRRRGVTVTSLEAARRITDGLGGDQALVLLPSRAVVVEGALNGSGRALGSGAWVDAIIRAGGTASEAVRYQYDLDGVWTSVDPGAAVLLPRPSFSALLQAVQDGHVMGRKTTSFRPKPLAGTVLRLR